MVLFCKKGHRIVLAKNSRSEVYVKKRKKDHIDQQSLHVGWRMVLQFLGNTQTEQK